MSGKKGMKHYPVETKLAGVKIGIPGGSFWEAAEKVILS